MGKGYSELETFCSIMNFPEPMNVKAFKNIQLNFVEAYISMSKTKAKKHFPKDNIHEGDHEDVVANITILCDSTWQKGVRDIWF